MAPWVTIVEGGLADGLFEGEEAVLHVMGVQIASEKRRNPLTSHRAWFAEPNVEWY